MSLTNLLFWVPWTALFCLCQLYICPLILREAMAAQHLGVVVSWICQDVAVSNSGLVICVLVGFWDGVVGGLVGVSGDALNCKFHLLCVIFLVKGVMGF